MIKQSTTDRVKGKFHEAKGAVKEKAGQLTNSPELQSEGIVEMAAGKVQGILGKLEKSLAK